MVVEYTQDIYSVYLHIPRMVVEYTQDMWSTTVHPNQYMSVVTITHIMEGMET